MMLFRVEHVPPILAREKTETRRLWARARAKVGSLHKCYSGGLPISKCPNCEGIGAIVKSWPETCPVCQGSGRLQPFATIRVLDVWQERLVDITDAGAKAEGYASRAEFMAVFGRINKLKNTQIRELVVFVVKFELAGAGE